MPSNWDIAFTIISIEGVFLVVTNLLAVTTIATSKQLRLLFSNFMLALLFTTHILSGCTNIFLSVVEINYRTNQKLVFFAHLVRDTIAGTEVIFTIFVPLERFCAISKPFFYEKLTKRHAVLYITFIFLFPIVFAVWRVFSRGVFMAAFIVTFVGAFVITITNTYLYRSVKKQCIHIASQIVGKSTEQQLEKRLSVQKRKLKALRMCIAFTLSYVLTWLPVGVKNMLNTSQEPTHWNVLIGAIGFSNGLWDVLIFFYVSRTAREHIKRFLKKISLSKIGSQD